MDMEKRPGWQAGRRFEMMAVWRESTVEEGHFLPEETAKAIRTFLAKHP